MKRAALLFLLLVACSSETPIQKAERHYDYLKAQQADDADLCQAARDGQNAAVDANASQVVFITWRSRVTVDCG